MIKGTKLTDSEGKTMGGTLWSHGGTVCIPDDERGLFLCNSGLLHFYELDVELAVMLDPLHAKYTARGDSYCAFEVEVDAVVARSTSKSGAHEIRVIKQLASPVVTQRQRIVCAVLSAFYAIKVAGVRIVDWETFARWWLRGVRFNGGYRDAALSVSYTMLRVVSTINSAVSAAHDSVEAIWRQSHERAVESAADSIRSSLHAVVECGGSIKKLESIAKAVLKDKQSYPRAQWS